MKILTDENIAHSVVLALRKIGYNVKDIKEEKLYGIADRQILEVARKEQRILLTHDKDFIHYKSDVGLILLRFRDQRPVNTIPILIKVFQSQLNKKLPKNITVISEDKVIIHKK